MQVCDSAEHSAILPGAESTAAGRRASLSVDDENPLHTLIAGLICFAIGMPFKYVLEESYAKSNEPDFPENQLMWCARTIACRRGSSLLSSLHLSVGWLTETHRYIIKPSFAVAIFAGRLPTAYFSGARGGTLRCDF